MRLIDADELIYLSFDGGIEFVPSEFIKEAPTIDAVEVVRCKDCKQYNGKIECGCGILTEPDDFCSYGERKNNETD